MDGTILIADDDRTIRTVLSQALTRAGCRVHATASLQMLLRWVEEGRGDLVITDVVMPDGNGIQALPQIARLRPGLPVIVISAQNTIMTAIQATEAAAFDYLPKPFDLPDLMKRVARGLGARRHAAPTTPAPVAGAAEELPMIGRAPQMQSLYRLVARVMNADLPILVTGESGAGKSLLARSIHDLSERRAQAFLTAGPADFVSAEAAQVAVTRARGGTLVLDELGDFDDAAQARLVRLIDALPGSGPRLIATTQEDLAARVGAGTFRGDLFYRLNGVTLDLPPLRDRVEDIALLADHFLARAERDGAGRHRLAPEALAFLRAQAWPGNVRQLETLLRRLVATAATEIIARPEVEAALAAATPPARAGLVPEGERLADSVARHLRRYFDLHGGALPPAGLYNRILREIEVPLIEIALDAVGGNQARCADLLGINRNTLHKRIVDLDISVTRRRKLM